MHFRTYTLPPVVPSDTQQLKNMSNDDPPEQDISVPLTTAANPAVQPKHSFFSLPPPVKRVFDKFPLQEYEANELPLRAPSGRGSIGLHVFATEQDAKDGRPSFNPSCLKWQTYLRLNGIDFTLMRSSNHASPTGSLPFLQPATPSGSPSTPDPIPTDQLRKWVAQQSNASQQISGPNHVRAELHQSLVENRVRKAWLYQLYLAPQNDELMQRLYVTPCSNNFLVRFTITRQLRAAAEAELVKSAGSNVVDAEVLIREAEEALGALSAQLGDHQWFFGEARPGLFDASLFAYTHLVLDEGLGWKFNPLGEVLSQHENLVRHRMKILQGFYGSTGDDGAARREVRVRTTSTLGKRKTLKSEERT